jgi:microcin C transport system substrate-binding protein
MATALQLAVAALLVIAASTGPPAGVGATPRAGHALSMYGHVKYGAGFTHFGYADPRAPKGGTVTLSALGTFDTLNPFTLKGMAAAGLGQVFDTLMVGSADEPFTEYGLVAETVEVPADRSWVTFTLRPGARFHDGRPITVEDVIWTFETLRAHGHPFYRSYYRHVARAERAGARAVRFTFTGGVNPELPLIVGQMPVLSKAWWAGRDFGATTLDLPLGSGPYRVERVEPGRSITYRRVADYWAAGLPVNAGRFNFDRIRYDYYRDGTVALEAFKGGLYDFRLENSAKDWATAYDVPAVREGRIEMEEIPHQLPTGMQGFVYNTRRAVFADRRVRRALARAFDFEWTNTYLFHGAYRRTESYFSNSELAAGGLPGPGELRVLEPFREHVVPEVFTRAYEAPSTEPGGLRPNLLAALSLLEQAGWLVRDTRLVHAATGRAMTFEILLDDRTWERIALPFVANLERLGVAARVRTVDSAQYQYRVEHFDFDMVVGVFPQSLSPGNEQADYWSRAAARTPGSRNLAGVSDPVVDALIAQVVAAPDRAALVARVRALDRVLLWGHYVIPHWHIAAFRVAYWDRFGRPGVTPKYALGFDTWWIASPGAVGSRVAAGSATRGRGAAVR